ncbi:MAG: hypothetical protein Ct9H300mP1_11510 [Planctomycetaceae bacterium]|nr:MAG: hypothetical protein Ct9H300mP1_11510 [Planctomycetaceae bacterium]
MRGVRNGEGLLKRLARGDAECGTRRLPRRPRPGAQEVVEALAGLMTSPDVGPRPETPSAQALAGCPTKRGCPPESSAGKTTIPPFRVLAAFGSRIPSRVPGKSRPLLGALIDPVNKVPQRGRTQPAGDDMVFTEGSHPRMPSCSITPLSPLPARPQHDWWVRRDRRALRAVLGPGWPWRMTSGCHGSGPPRPGRTRGKDNLEVLEQGGHIR